MIKDASIRVPSLPSKAVAVEEIIFGSTCKYLPDDLTYADGSSPDSDFTPPLCPEGDNNPPTFVSKSAVPKSLPKGSKKGQKSAPSGTSISDPPSSGTTLPLSDRDIAVSSGKNKDALIAYTSKGNVWESNGTAPHSITITLPNAADRRRKWFRVEMYTTDHDSYNPDSVTVNCGPSISDVKQVNNLNPGRSDGWVEIASVSDIRGVVSLPPLIVKIDIQPPGINCKVSAIRIVEEGKGPSVSSPLLYGEQVCLSDNFKGTLFRCYSTPLL